MTPNAYDLDDHPITARLTDTPMPSARIAAARASGGPVRDDGEAGDFPAVGETFLGFKLVEPLGAGAFARVFLAHQGELADRPVALKVTTRPTREPQRLARLQHTNIVPIHSVHDQFPVQAVCMPFLGRRTLADLVTEYRAAGSFPRTATPAASTAALARSTQVSPRPVSPGRPAPPISVPTELPAPTGATPEEQVDLVLGLLSGLAGGLAHAHDRGILHLDLKPANVLLADDGQPLLLDFNLSFDVRSGDRPEAGGTLPYMAPEQLEEYRDGGPSRVDHRTDLYALGVIAFELLTGKHPFPLPAGKRADVTALVDARKAGAPRLAPHNPAVSPAVESVVRTLLDPIPAKRYQSARELVEDLDRHRHNLPLAHAADRSVREQVAKWRRRNPRAALYLALAGLGLGAAGLGAAVVRQTEHGRQEQEKRERLDATAAAALVRTELATIRADLSVWKDATYRTKGLARGREILARYDLPERGADWVNSDGARMLSDDARASLGDDLGELALLMAHAEWLGGCNKSDADRRAAVARAEPWNRAAEACFAGRAAPEAVAAQRQRFAGGDDDDFDPDADTPAPDASPIDLYVRAVELMAAGHFRAAAAYLEDLTAKAPGHFAGQFMLGACRQETGSMEQAQERYRMAQALAPADPRPTFNRGTVLLVLGRSTEAEAAFSAVLARTPDYKEAYLQRALARMRFKPAADPGAIEDLTAALDRGASPIRVLMTRATAYDAAGNRDAAARDRDAAGKMTPVDAFDYLSRGWVRLKQQDADGALADFVKSAELNRYSLGAWQNQAYIWSDLRHENENALVAQEQAVAVAPEYAPARVGRAVLYARLDRRKDAHADAEWAAVASTDADVLYQAACVYALTARAEPADYGKAEEYFRRALRAGYPHLDQVDRDPDLTAALRRPEFREALNGAKLLAKKAGAANPPKPRP